MLTKEDIDLAFQELNITLDDAILNKCYQLCQIYNIHAAEDFCDQWYAFTASYLNTAAPTIENLEKMERKVFHKNKDHSFSKRKYEDIEETQSSGSDFQNAELTPQPMRVELSKPSPVVKTPVVKTPVTQVDETLTNSSQKFVTRTDSMSVQRSYGSATAKFQREEGNMVSVKEVKEHQVPYHLTFMCEEINEKAKRMNNMVRKLGHDILDKNGLILSEGALMNRMEDNLITYGRIVSESKGALNDKSILLEGSDESNLNFVTRLSVKNLSKYSLFPGQVVAAKGTNVKTRAFMADRIFTTADLELPEEVPCTKNTIQIVVAAGPFTLAENLSYEPLHELLKYVNEHKPNVLLLAGPFLDEANTFIPNYLTQTFDCFFEELIANIMNSVQHLGVHVVIVSSSKDIFHHPEYPTVPYRIKEKYEMLTFVSDPGIIEVDGLRIAITTPDILLHMSGSELHFDSQAVIRTGRLERLASHLLHQKNMYPLFPPHQEVCLDHVLLEQFGTLKVKPHILILPSKLKCFIKDVEDCLIINPEKLTTGYQGGTFARIEIRPGLTKTILDRAGVEILRV